MDALAGLDPQRSLAAEEVLDLVGPDPGRVDHHPRPDLQVHVVLQVASGHPDHPAVLAEEAGDLGPRGHVRAVRRRGAGDRHHQPGVVDLAVVVLDRPGQLVGAQVGRDPGDLLAEEVPVPGDAHVVLAGPRTSKRHGVVQRDACADVRPLPGVVQRVEERDRPDQVRRQAGQQQAALLQRLADQREVEHLQVAQAAVDQLAAAAAGAAGVVALLQQRRGEPAADRVQGDADPDDPAADHQDVELVALVAAAHRGQGLRP